MLITKGGEYYANHLGPCLYHIDTFIVTLDSFLTSPNIPKDSSHCKDISILKIVLPNNFSFIINEINTNSNILSDPPNGIYQYYGKNLCNEILDSIRIINDHMALELPDSIEICKKNDFITLESGITNTNWSNGHIGPTIDVNEPGIYNYYVSNSCGEFNYETKVFLFNDIVLPNVFSPNGDGVNDVFPLIINGSFSMEVFDRWGNLVGALMKDMFLKEYMYLS